VFAIEDVVQSLLSSGSYSLDLKHTAHNYRSHVVRKRNEHF